MKNLEKKLYETVSRPLLGRCQLWHPPGETLPEAVDFIHQQLRGGATLRVPVCQECITAIHSGEWVLLFCVCCLESRWVNLFMTKRPHLYINGNGITWMDGCPECSGGA